MHDEPSVLTRVREALSSIPAPPRDFDRVADRARRLRRRRLVVGAFAGVLVAAGVIVPLAALRALHSGPVHLPGGQRTQAPVVVPVIDFHAAPGWNVVTTDPSLADLPGAPQAWAANVPFDPKDLPPGVMQVYPG